MWKSFVDALKVEYNAIHIWAFWRTESADTNLTLPPTPNSAYDNMIKVSSNWRRKVTCVGQYRTHNLRISRRTVLNEETVTLYGWPSRGGVIVLENATPPDFDFLGLDALDPPLRREPDQIAEDAFCQGLLRLGATWWDSEGRRDFVRRLEYGGDEDEDEIAFAEVEEDPNLEPSIRERLWVRVAWPSHPPGALCVLACEKFGNRGQMTTDDKSQPPRPKHHGVISLTRTMDERCVVLQRLGGIMYTSIDEYQGPTFLKAWEENHQGERGALARIKFIDPSIYGGHPDDALGRFQQRIQRTV